MDCHEFRREIAEYPDREVSREMGVAIEAHAAACSACAGDLRVFRAMRDGLASLPAIAASRDFEARLERRLSGDRRGTSERVLRFPSWARWVAVAAAAAIVVGIGALLLRPDGGSRRVLGEFASHAADNPAIDIALPTTRESGAGAAGDRGEVLSGRSGLDDILTEEGASLVPQTSGRNYVIDRPSDLPLLLPGGVEGEAASAPISF